MAYNNAKGRFSPRNPQKYAGNPNNIIYRSGMELTFMRYCDSRPHVLRWASEELAISYYFGDNRGGDGKWHKYFPDFLLHVRVRPDVVETWLVEIKPYIQTQPPKQSSNQRRYLKEATVFAKNQAKWKAAMEYCQAKRWKFIVITEKDLYTLA